MSEELESCPVCGALPIDQVDSGAVRELVRDRYKFSRQELLDDCASREALEEALKEVDDLLDEYPPDLIGTGGHPGQAEEARVDRIMEAVRERVERRQAAIRALKEDR